MAKSYWENDFFKIPYQMGVQPHREFLLDLLKEKEVVSILDVGCGTGPIYQMIQEDKKKKGQLKWRWPFDYKGVDYSKTMIATAKREFPDGDFEVQDMRKLKELDDSWDCVLLMHALDHVDKYEEAIKEAARVAERYVCIVLWRKFVPEGTALNSVNTMDRDDGIPWDDTHMQDYSMDVLFDAFRAAKLEVEKIEVGGKLNGSYARYNSLFLLRKEGK